MVDHCTHHWLVSNPEYFSGTPSFFGSGIFERTSQTCKLCGEVRENLVELPADEPDEGGVTNHTLFGPGALDEDD